MKYPQITKVIDATISLLFGAAILLGATLAIAIGLSSDRNNFAEQLQTRIDQFDILLSGLSLLTAIVLILWVAIASGLDSRLWKWLPPFVLFRNSAKSIRLGFVLFFVFAIFWGLLT